MHSCFNQNDRLEAKLDKMDEKIDAMAVVQATQAVILEGQAKILAEHIRRTGMAEDRLVPLEKHMNFMHSGMRWIGGITTVATGFIGFIKLFQMIKGG